MKIPKASTYPKTILIGAKEVPYSIKFFDNKKYLGKCCAKKKAIYLNSKQPRTHLLMTLLHEVLHAIEFESGRKVKHKLIYTFEEGIYSFLLNNVSELKFNNGVDSVR